MTMTRTLTALSLLLGLALACWACTIPEPEDACTGVDCSGHGECQIYTDVNGDHPLCICESGYLRTVDGTGCYQFPPPGDADTDQ